MKAFRKLFMYACAAAAFFMPVAAHAGASLVDNLDLSPIVPLVLDALMTVATGGYDFFVSGPTGGIGIIYTLVWGFLAVSMALYAVKIHIPNKWLAAIGMSGGGQIADGADATKLAQDMLKPAVRAIVAAAILLQIRPVYLTEVLVNPFLQFGALYTDAIIETINEGTTAITPPKCPQDIVEKAWISESSCEFLVQPVATLSHANNQVIKRGFDFINSGLRGLITLVPHGGTDFLNLVTGILLVFTFVSCNFFMALLIIQAIFNFGMALILYPFSVLAWVAKPSDKWLDLWPPFNGVLDALKKIIVTMIACAFMLCINVAIIRALFQWNSSVFVVAAGGTATSNVPQTANMGVGFGAHSMLWLSAILTFYVMLRLFELTREQLNKYVGSNMSDLYNKTKSDATRLGQVINDARKRITKAFKGK